MHNKQKLMLLAFVVTVLPACGRKRVSCQSRECEPRAAVVHEPAPARHVIKEPISKEDFLFDEDELQGKEFNAHVFNDMTNDVQKVVMADAALPIDKEGFDCAQEECVVRHHTTQYERNMRHEVEEIASECATSHHKHPGHETQRERALEDEIQEHPCDMEEVLEEVCS